MRPGLVVMMIVLVACATSEPKPPEAVPDDTGATPPSGDTGDTAVREDTFDPTNVTFEFDGVLRRDGVLDGYWTPGSAHVEPDDWNPPTVQLTFADERLFDGIQDDRYLCTVTAQYVSEAVDDLGNENDAPLSHAWDGWLDLFYFPYGDDRVTFTDCPDKVDEDIWGPDGADLWAQFDGARFGFALGDMSRTDLRDFWGADYAAYEDSLVAAYIAVNVPDDAGELTFQGNALASCLLFEYDAATGELADPDGDGLLEEVDVSGIAEGEPLPESYVRCFAYYWPEISVLDLARMTEGANGGPP